MPVFGGPNVVEDGVIFAADAANQKSYYSNSNSVYFDGSGDLVTVGPNTALDLTGDFTIELWLNRIGTGGFVINRGGGLNIAWASYEIALISGDIYFAASSANSGYDIGGENATGRIGTVTANQWTHVAVTRSGNVYRGFINGVQGYTQTLALTPYSATTRGLNIGASYQNAWGVVGNIASVMTGYVSNVRIIKGTALYTSNFTVPSAPLTRVTNTSLLTCQDRTFVDNSTNNFTITTFGNVTTTAHSPFNGTSINDLSINRYTGPFSNRPVFDDERSGNIVFNGSDQFISLGNVLDATTNSFSVEVWFNKTGNSTSNSFGGAMIAKDAYGPNNGWAVFVNNSDYVSGTCGFQTRASGVVYGANSTFTIQNNVWYHLVGVRDTVNKTNYLYINGVLNGSAAENPTVNPTNSTATVIGNVSGQSRHFNGKIAMVKVYNKTLSAQEVSQLFNATCSRFGLSAR